MSCASYLQQLPLQTPEQPHPSQESLLRNPPSNRPAVHPGERAAAKQESCAGTGRLLQLVALAAAATSKIATSVGAVLPLNNCALQAPQPKAAKRPLHRLLSWHQLRRIAVTVLQMKVVDGPQSAILRSLGVEGAGAGAGAGGGVTGAEEVLMPLEGFWKKELEQHAARKILRRASSCL